jgi:tetratricopeptide (TPR) repeat protein
MRSYYFKPSFILLFVLSCVTMNVAAQKQGREKIDSILSVIKNYKSTCNFSCFRDTEYIHDNLNLAIEISRVNPDTATVLATKVTQLLQKINWPQGNAELSLLKGLIYAYKGDYLNAMSFYDSALSVWKKMLVNNKNNTTILGDLSSALNNKANVYNYKGDYQKALESYYESLKNYRQINDSLDISSILGNIGLIYTNMHDYKNALAYYDTALAIKTKLQDRLGIANTTDNIGLVYAGQGDYVKAIGYHFNALKIDEELKNSDGVARDLNNIGHVYSAQKDFQKALVYYLQSLKICDDKLDKRGAEIATGDIGNIYSALANAAKDRGDSTIASENFTNALLYFVRAAALAGELGIKDHAAVWLGNIGNLYQSKKDYDKAISYFFDELKVVKDIDPLNTAITYGNIGDNYYHRKKFHEAEKYYLTSLGMSDSLRDLEGILEINQSLSRLYGETNNYKKALTHYKLAMAAKDSLFNAGKTEEITRKEIAYDQEKKDAVQKVEQERRDAESKSRLEKQKWLTYSIGSGAVIIFLASISIFIFYKRKRDAEQKQKETFLSLQVSETEMKALRSQMNPHFIFNALQSIQTFLLSHRSEEANAYLLKFAKLMRLVLENSQHSEVPLKDDMQALELYMQLESIRLRHAFTYQFHIDSSVDVENDSIPPLILQPFVENAIWHGLQYKPEPGHINIFIKKINNALFATVEDNGVGRDMSKEVSQPMLLKRESLGMKLTGERLKILNELKNVEAQFNITDLFTTDKKPAGTKVELLLPFA